MTMKTRRIQAYNVRVGDTIIRTVTSKRDHENVITSLFTVTAFEKDFEAGDLWFWGTYDMGDGVVDGFCHMPTNARTTLIHRPREAK
jgi:hypothetical protein